MSSSKTYELWRFQSCLSIENHTATMSYSESHTITYQDIASLAIKIDRSDATSCSIISQYYNIFALVSSFLWSACLTYSRRSACLIYSRRPSSREFPFSSVTYNIMIIKQDHHATLTKASNIKGSYIYPSTFFAISCKF